jgi:predicted transcriptional regulator
MRALLKRIKMPPDAVTTPDAAKALGLHLAGYTYVEIAAELGCTPDEAYDLVRQALKAMKRLSGSDWETARSVRVGSARCGWSVAEGAF